MDRRTLLRLAALGAAGLPAGCLDRGGSGDDGAPATTDGENADTDDTSGDDAGSSDGGWGDTDDPTGTESTPDDDTPGEDDTPDGDDTPGEDDPPGEDDTQTETDGDGSGGGSSGDAMVDQSFEVVRTECGQGAQRAAVERGADSVDVDGTIRGRNGCYTAELERTTYDDGAGELEVEVRSVDGSEEGEACQQCIVDVEYRARFEFEDGTPDEVHVLHDGEHVTTG